jgi:LuxR family maltose regulon positive regulatory protein
MSTPILATKLYIPAPRPNTVLRPRLIERLNEGLDRRLTLISAPAGFGKTTLVSEWVAGWEWPAAWLSVDDGDNDPMRFLTYFVAALRTINATVGDRVLAVLQSPQPPTPEAILTTLLNEIASIPDHFVLVLDDYHVIDAPPIDQALTFLLEHQPPQMHLVIATREDPDLPLARLRVRGQLAELRAADLRFTPTEAADFLNRVMGLGLSAEDTTALETRTEGWIAGLQLAAISMQSHPDATSFITSFTGSHHFVMDYLMEEVLQQQPENIQMFLLRTSFLDRLCGPLCDAVLRDPATSAQEILEYLERANLFLLPLDNERHWYRYHHLFADLLRQRLHQSEDDVTELYCRASQWYEDNGLELEAFHYAVHDIDRAARLIEGKGMPLQFRGAVTPVLNWLASLSPAVLDAHPSLWVMYASSLSITGQTGGVEEKLQAAEAALSNAEPDEKTRNLIGHIAAIRALLAAAQYQVETIITQSRRALEYLHPNNVSVRTATIWKLGIAYQYQGDRVAASRSYSEAITISQASGNRIIHLAALTGLGNIQEADNQLYLAAETYQRVLQLMGEPLQPSAYEALLGLARITYEWNDLDAAQQYGQQSFQLAQQIQKTDRTIGCELFLARLKLAQGDAAGAAAVLARADQLVRQSNFFHRVPEIAAVQVLTHLRQGNLEAAAHLAETHDLPISRAQVYLAQGEPSAALAVLESYYRQVEAKGWLDEQLKVRVQQVVALRAYDDQAAAAHLLVDTLALAEPGGFIRIFVDEGLPMASLAAEAAARGIMPDYTRKLLVAFASEPQAASRRLTAQPLIEPLSQRELEVLQLIAEGLSNLEISERLFLALNTVKGHNQKIFGKLQVQRRTEAVARARELGLV